MTKKFHNIYEAASELFMLSSFFQICFPVLVVNSLCKNMFLIFLANSLFSLSGKWTSKFSVFPVP